MIYPELEYNDEKHQYKIKGVVQPSVTQVLQVITDYSGVPKAVLQKAAERGTAVHRATELADLGTLDWGRLDDELIPYVMAWEQFKHDAKPEILAVERRTFHPALLFAGTLDRELILNGKRGVLDIKSSVALMPSVGPQLAAYMESENAHREKADRMKARWGLQLKKNGKYKLVEYKDANDWQDFLGCLRVVRFQQRHGKWEYDET